MKIIAKKAKYLSKEMGENYRKSKLQSRQLNYKLFSQKKQNKQFDQYAHFITVRYCVNFYDVILINDPME